MAPSTVVAKPPAKSPKPKKEVPKEVAKAPSNTPYQLDKEQVLKASRALLKFVANQKDEGSKPNLLQDEDESSDGAEAIWLNLTTKKFISDVKKLKPSRIALPHPLRTSENTTACLIVKDPQRAFKDLVEASSLSATITKVIGITKLRAKFKTFESRRLLCNSHDVFLADDRVVLMLPKLLGKPFYSKSSKVPIPVNFEGAGAVGNPDRLKSELKKALNSTYIHLSSSSSTAIRVGLSSFTPEQLVENIDATVKALVEKKIPAGWKGVRSLHIKSPNSAALPIWMTQELYADDDVLKPADQELKALRDAKKAEKRGAKKLKRKAEREEYVKNKTLLAAGQKTEEMDVDTVPEPVLVNKAAEKSEEKLVEREVAAKKKRKSLGDVVDAGLDVTVKEAKKMKTKKAM